MVSSSYASCRRQLMSSVWSGCLLLSQPEAIWIGGYSSRTVAERTPHGGPSPFYPRSWNAPLTSRVHNPGYSLLSSMDGADRVEEAVAAHLCPAATANWRVRNRASLSSKPCHRKLHWQGILHKWPSSFSTACDGDPPGLSGQAAEVSG